MKTTRHIHYWMSMVIATVIIAGCSEDFLERPPKAAVVDGSFFKTDEQVLAGTALLYSKVWFDYNDKASYNLGDFRGGTLFSGYNDRDNVEFNTTANTPDNGAAWRAFFNVVGQSNTVIQNINRYAGPDVSPAIKRTAIAEARFMRSLAYRFLVMNWGPVPVIENNFTLLTDTTIRRNTVESVWKYIIREMRAAAADLPETPVLEGRVTKWSAEGMLARFYLTYAGVGGSPGSRNQQYLDSAKYYAQRVIEQSGAELLTKTTPDDEPYARLFLFPYDNNSESLFSLQWVYSGPTNWGTQNSTPAYLAYSGDIANGDGWGGDKGATLWMLQQYEGLMANGRTLDQRLKATFMLPGAHYPEITQSITGGEQELIYPLNGTDVNFCSVKKYVTGKAKDVGGEAASQRYGHDTYMMRLAEMYLVYVEADLGNQPDITGGKAAEYFNAIRTRAGLPEWTELNPDTNLPEDRAITFEDIFRERIIEFAMEGMAWYDLVSLHYYDKQAAYDIISDQDRGLFFADPDQFPDPTSWTFTETSWNDNRKFTAYDGNFQLPIPAAELSQAPNLGKDAVDYFAN